MQWFSRKKNAPEREPDPDVLEARAAQERAHSDMRKVREQGPEVAQLITSLEARRRQNNFGKALEVAMEARAR